MVRWYIIIMYNSRAIRLKILFIITNYVKRTSHNVQDLTIRQKFMLLNTLVIDENHDHRVRGFLIWNYAIHLPDAWIAHLTQSHFSSSVMTRLLNGWQDVGFFV